MQQVSSRQKQAEIYEDPYIWSIDYVCVVVSNNISHCKAGPHLVSGLFRNMHITSA